MRWYSLILIGYLMLGCNTDVVYEKNLPVNAFGWNMADTLRYAISISDTAQRYDLSVALRHTDAFDYTNIYIKVISLIPNGEVKSEVISLPLCDETGKWLGKCSGDICFSRILLLKRTYFPIKGDYQFYIVHEMRQEKLKNILDLGLRLEKSPKKIYAEDEE